MNYATLKTSIDDWLARSDISDEAISDTLIDMAEAYLNRKLRIRQMEVVYNETIANGVTSYPSGLLEFKHLYVYQGDGATVGDLGIIDPSDNSISVLEWRDMNSFSRETGNGTGEPKFAARQGDKIVYWPRPTGTRKVGGIYYGKFTALDDDNSTNWLTDNAPDLLIAATLAEASAYIQAPDKEEYWSNRRDMLMADIQAADDRAEDSATPLTMRPGSPTP